MQIVFPFLTRLPRFFLPIVGTAIYLPIAIAAAAHFAAALSNFLGLLGYWSAIFVAVLLVEVRSLPHSCGVCGKADTTPRPPVQHFLFRKGRFSSYDVAIWDRSSLLPPGLAALFASLCGAAFVVLGMDQVVRRLPFPFAHSALPHSFAHSPPSSLLSSPCITHSGTAGSLPKQFPGPTHMQAETSGSRRAWQSRPSCSCRAGSWKRGSLVGN